MKIERNNELMEAVHNKLPANLSMQLYIDEARWNSEIARLTAELAELRERTRWIPVSERLPEKAEKYYWCWMIDEHTCKTRLDFRYFFSDRKWDSLIYTVTHWMPLPEPPEADDADN